MNIPRVRFLPHYHHLATMLPIKYQYLLSSICWSLWPNVPSNNTSLFTGVELHTGSLFIRRGVLRSSENSTFLPFIVSFEILSGPRVLNDDLETSQVVRYSGVEDPVWSQTFLEKKTTFTLEITLENKMSLTTLIFGSRRVVTG